MDTDPYNLQREPLLIVISGPSGVGKDTVVHRLKERGVPFHFVVTTTDRQPRPDEVDGVNYNFVSTEQFEQMIEENELLEWACVYGDYKGVPKQQVRQAFSSGKDVIMRLDVQGAATIKKLAPDAILIFLVANSEADMIERLRARHSDTEEAIRKRMVIARQEYTRIDEFDYCVLNPHNNVDFAVEEVLAIIRTEHARVKQRIVKL
ncbi:MAG: guanylate kinase [Anaerolineales bacterium]|nr:guanylate kinase [Anaerolineales bacterium]